jgi:hypothetical protein
MEAQADVLALKDFEHIITFYKRNMPMWSTARLKKVLDKAVALTHISDKVVIIMMLRDNYVILLRNKYMILLTGRCGAPPASSR